MSCQVNTNPSSALSKALRQCSQDVDYQIQYQSSSKFGRVILWFKNIVSHLFYPRGSVEDQIQKIEQLVKVLDDDQFERRYVTQIENLKLRLKDINTNTSQNETLETIKRLAFDKLSSKLSSASRSFKDPTYNVGATYKQCRNGKPAEDGILDVAYVDHENGFAFVADGPSHGKPEKKEGIVAGMEQFKRAYEDALFEKGEVFKRSPIRFVQDTVSAFSRAMEEYGHVNGSAFALAQTVDIDGRPYLIAASYADCMIVVRRSDGRLDHTNADRHGGGIGTDEALRVEIFDLEEGDEVFGFSDGIGEFLTKDQFKEVLDNNTDRNQLLSELKEKIQTKASSTNETAFVGGTPKVYNSEDSNGYDDIALFSFKIGQKDPAPRTYLDEDSENSDS